MKKIIGSAMVAAPFVAFFAIGVWRTGWLPIAGLFLCVGLFTLWISYAIGLIIGDGS